VSDDLGTTGWVFLTTILVLLLAMGVIQLDRFVSDGGCSDAPLQGEWAHVS
jgi:hypothetical protein